MLSSDKNVETLAQLIELLKHYFGLHAEYATLTVIDKVVRLLTAVALAIIFCLLIVAVLIFFWIAAGLWLGQFCGTACAFLIVSGLHLLLLALFFIFRESWIERPLVRFLANLLMS
jgi:hypothetical protein